MKIHFLIALSALFLYGVTLPHASHAQASTCSVQDLRDIKKFNRKADRVIDKILEYQIEAGEAGDSITSEPDLDEIEKISAKIKKEKSFFRSEEYNAQRELFVRCNKRMPEMDDRFFPFWIPKSN